MTTTNKQTAAIWAEKLGDAYVGCYGLLDDLDREDRGKSPVRLSLSVIFLRKCLASPSLDATRHKTNIYFQP